MITGLRLLLLLPFAPRLDAAHGGGRLIAQFLSEITDRCQVAILYLRSTDEPGVDDYFRNRCELVEEFIRPPIGKSFSLRLSRRIRLIKAMLQLRPMWVADWNSKSFMKQAGSIIRKFQPDIVQIEYHVMGQYLASLNGSNTPLVLIEHEPGIIAAPYIRNLPTILEDLINKLDRKSWQRYETALFRQVNAIIVFTDADKKAIEKLANRTPIHVIPPGIRVPSHSLNPLGYPPPTLLFFGNFIHPPNIEAAIRLARNIFPGVQEYFPELELYLVGDQPPPELLKLSDEKIHVTGWVPDITTYLDQAAVFVSPLTSGGGMRVKILEALASGKAVVATPLSVEGLDLIDGEQVSLGASDQELVERIVRLLANTVERQALAENARNWAVAHSRWEKTIEAYERLYQSLLAGN